MINSIRKTRLCSVAAPVNNSSISNFKSYWTYLKILLLQNSCTKEIQLDMLLPFENPYKNPAHCRTHSTEESVLE